MTRTMTRTMTSEIVPMRGCDSAQTLVRLVRRVVGALLDDVAGYQGPPLDDLARDEYRDSLKGIRSEEQFTQLRKRIRRECEFRPTPKRIAEWVAEMNGTQDEIEPEDWRARRSVDSVIAELKAPAGADAKQIAGLGTSIARVRETERLKEFFEQKRQAGELTTHNPRSGELPKLANVPCERSPYLESLSPEQLRKQYEKRAKKRRPQDAKTDMTDMTDLQAALRDVERKLREQAESQLGLFEAEPLQQ